MNNTTAAATPGDRKELLRDALSAIERLKARLAVYEKAAQEPIAIIGAGCRFPGGIGDLDSYWNLLRQGACAVEPVPLERWALLGRGHFEDQFYAGLLKDTDKFDASFFGISPREALTMDPQQRVVMEVAWEALENAGQAPSKLAGSKTGVFLGLSAGDYLEAVRSGEGFENIYAATGTAHSVAAGRVSYVLGLHGPAVALDTACSSSLVAIHLACQSLRAGESSMAIAGGVNLVYDPRFFRCLNGWGMMAPDGLCKTFDSAADGFVRSDGCGLIILKRLSDAVASRDNILALIRASVINHDGRSSGLTVPSGIAQEKLLRDALAQGGINPHDIQYVEAHGTGTSLGDPIEVQAIDNVLANNRPEDRPLYLGSVKTNLGHMESAAGVGGLLKVVLAMQHGIIPKHLHFKGWSPLIPLSGAPLRVPANETEWPAADRRMACVSAFGFSGTNAHVILEQAPAPEPATSSGVERPLHLMTVSAPTRTAAARLAELHADHLEAHPELAAGDACFTANAGRSHYGYRIACRGASAAELAGALRQAKEEGKPAPRAGQTPRIAFLFTGQGSQHAGMAKQLAATQPVFREAFDRCGEILKGILDQPLDALMFGSDNERLAQTGYSQPVLFALEYALAEMWRSWGIRPSFLMGHSLGEYVAACVAGVFPVEAALPLVALRGQKMQALPAGGRMAAVSASQQVVQAAIAGLPRTALAAVNGPESMVISGAAPEVEAAVERLQKDGHRCHWLNVSHAFHSPLLDPMLGDLEEAAARIPHAEAQVSLISNLTGDVAEPGSMNAAYWRLHARQPVQFRRGIEAMRRRGANIFLEIGPGSTLLGLGRECVDNDGAIWVPSLSSKKQDWTQLLDSVATLYEFGVDFDWDGFDAPYGRRRVALPTYPWERHHYWPSTGQGREQVQRVGQGAMQMRRVSSPSLHEAVWEFSLSASDPAIADHKINGEILFPMTGYFDLIRASGVAAVQKFTIEQPLRLEAGQTVTAQVTSDGSQVTVYSLQGDQWVRHGGGQVATVSLADAAELEGLDSLRERISEPVAMEGFYERAQKAGLEYGESYRRLTSTWLKKDEGLGQVNGSDQFLAALDACLHVLFPVIDRRIRAQLLPSGVDAIEFYSGLQGQLWVHARLRDVGAESVVADLDVRSEGGALACRIRGFRARKVASQVRNLMHEIVWREAPLAEGAASAGGNWLIVSDSGTAHKELAAALLQAGGKCRTVKLTELDGSLLQQESWSGLVYLAGLDTAAESEAGRTLYDLIRKLRTAPAGMRLWLVTRGAQPLARTPVDPLQAPVWGMGRCLALEHPEWRWSMVDIEPSGDGAGSLAQELLCGGNEAMTAWRKGVRYAARLARQRAIGSGSRKLIIQTPGVLDELQSVPTERITPGPDDIEIRVAASGLNYRDVLTALGLIPVLPSGLGGECSGVVERVGVNVKDFAPGDEVMALAGSSFADYVTVNEGLAAPKPAGVTFAEAAAIPAVYGTCIYALEELARLKAGETILIHSGTGGVGLSSIELAKRIGATVLATAGSEARRQYLRDLGIQHVFDSRSKEFTRQVLEVTGGRGVDVVLNSLSGELIQASIESVAQGGRFIELGKRGIWTPEQVAAIRPDLGYHIFDLGTQVLADAGWTREMMRELSRRIAAGECHALPVQIFSQDQASDAFRFMAQAMHTGKIVLAQAGYAAARHRDVQPTGAYLVTGGLGALGLQTAEWLAREGAKTVVLVGRRAPSEEAAKVIGRLREEGVRVEVRPADIADRTQLEGLLAEIRTNMGPLRGVFHAAGVLDDRMAVDQSWESASKVMAPKITGGANLHQLTLGDPIDFFVLYSSASAVMGSPGQASYAAGNAYLDALAHARRQAGLAAISINWGAWGSAGMAAELSEQQLARWRAAGMEPLSSAEGFQALKLALESVSPQAMVMDLNWELFGQQAALRPDSAFFAELTQSSERSSEKAEDDLVAGIWSAPPAERLPIVLGFIVAQAKRVLALPATFTVDENRSLQDLGLDSVMAVELRTRIDRGLRVAIPTVALLDGTSVQKLAEDVLAKLPGVDGAADAAAGAVDQLVDAIPDADVDAMLQQVLEQGQPRS